MPKPDGSIRIDTKIESGNVTSQMMKIANAIKKDMAEVERLNAKMDELASKKIPTEEYKILQDSLKKAEDELNNLVTEQKNWEELGIHSGDAWDALNKKVISASDNVDSINAKMQSLVDAGKAFTFGGDTEQLSKMAIRAGELSGRIESNNLRLREMYEKQKPLSKEFEKMSKSAKKAFSAISSGTKKSNASLSSGLKTILKYGFGIRSLYVLFNKIRSGIASGLKNLMDYSTDFADSVQSMKNAMATLGNQIAAAFSPIIQMVIPWINQLISALSTAMTYVAQFIAALGGSSTFTRAKKVQDSYNKSLDGTAKSAKKAFGALASFDTLEVLNKKDAGGGAGAGAGASDMFEEVPVDPKVISWLGNIKSLLQPLIGYMKKLKDIFMDGFWDGLGDWEYRIDSIKNSAAIIKESLIDILTDPAVLAAADSYVKSVVSMFGTLVGSLASIGLTIATNIVGGIAIYIEENKERIKDYLISMFDIWGDVNNLLASFFDSFAYVFEAFASENGQQLTANLIGIFLDAFMGTAEILSKLIRDILNIFIQPFVDNKENFRTALEGLLGVLSEVAGTIKDSIDQTFDKLNEVYDAHFKPFFDSVANGLSGLTESFLNFWIGNLKPILEGWAQIFDEVWGGHIQPIINSIIGLLGSLADLLKALWENILQPFMGWIIENILPVVWPVINGVVSALLYFLGIVGDVASNVIEDITGIITFLTDIFSGDWKAAWNDIKDFLWSAVVSDMENAGQNIINGLKNGILSAWNGLKESVIQSAENTINLFRDIFGIHSPSTVFEEIGGFLIQGLVNGISGAVSLVTDAISGLVDTVLGFFGFDKWTEAGENMITSITEAVSEFRTLWTESFDEWKELNNELYFGYDVWYEQFNNILLAYNDINAQFMAEWQSNMNMWWTTMVMPFFEVAKWTLFGTQMKTGIMTGFKVIVNEMGGVLNKLISMFNAAFRELESAMNDLISSYNANARELGTSTLSHVHYRAISPIKVPALADGAVLRGGNPFMAIVNDQPRGQVNVETPVSVIEDAVNHAFDNRQIQQPVEAHITMTMNGEVVGEAIIDNLMSALNRRGYDVDVLGWNGG